MGNKYVVSGMEKLIPKGQSDVGGVCEPFVLPVHIKQREEQGSLKELV